LEPFPHTLLGPDFAHIQIEKLDPSTGNPTIANSLDSFGNLEVSPPCTVGTNAYALGRIYYGDGGQTGRQMDEALRIFLDRQSIQQPVTLNGDWLDVGHVDEFMSIVPNPLATNGWTVLFADPGLALAILTGNELTTNGIDGRLAIPRYVDHGFAPPVQLSDLLARQTTDPNDGATTIAQYNAAGGPVHAMLLDLEARLIEQFGLGSSEDIYHVPVLFDAVEQFSGPSKAGALTPDLANGAAHGSVYIAPDPFLHAYSVINPPSEEDSNANFTLDPTEDSNGNGLLDTLRDPFQVWMLQNLPGNLGVEFIDDWYIYHVNSGEVHCSSNERRAIPAGPNTDRSKWWNKDP